MADHNKPEKVTVDPGVVGKEIPQGAIGIGESHLHESSAVTLRPIITTTIAMLMIIVVSDLALLGLYKFWTAREKAAKLPDSPLLTIPVKNEDPKLQVDEPAVLHRDVEEMAGPIDGYKWVEPGKTAAVPVDEAMKRIAESGKLPSGPDWSLRPDERMIGGVIMNPEQVRYANTPPSQALVGEPGAAPTGPPPAATPAAAPAQPAAQPAARPAAAPAGTPR